MRKLLIPAIFLALMTCHAAAQQVPPAAEPPGFTVAVAERALDQFRSGLIGHNERQLLSIFSPSEFPDYPGFSQTIASLFRRYDTLRVYSHIKETGMEAGRGFAVVEFTLEAVPRDETGEASVRRTTQLRFTFAPEGREWRAVEFQPRNFFDSF